MKPSGFVGVILGTMIFLFWIMIFTVLLVMVFPRFFAGAALAWIALLLAGLTVWAVCRIQKSRFPDPR